MTHKGPECSADLWFKGIVATIVLLLAIQHVRNREQINGILRSDKGEVRES